ncbi:hypothetical protein AVEN_239854-1 [Araneus ventricosus]|uniref:Uncharacterized protein n=1 Tax=Araneus ventricosus TaxID=182803 RepID=A0A4Y2FAP6_ARAVE|nr:hypothetical protein AVEN_239854-1 [Araneus ventricosus]
MARTTLELAPLPFSNLPHHTSGKRLMHGVGFGAQQASIHDESSVEFGCEPGGIFTNPTLIELRQEISQYHWLRGAVTSFSALARSVRQS